MKDAKTRSKEILSVVVDDPAVDEMEPEEVREAALDLAEDLCLRNEVEDHIERATAMVAFQKATEVAKVQQMLDAESATDTRAKF